MNAQENWTNNDAIKWKKKQKASKDAIHPMGSFATGNPIAIQIASKLMSEEDLGFNIETIKSSIMGVFSKHQRYKKYSPPDESIAGDASGGQADFMFDDGTGLVVKFLVGSKTGHVEAIEKIPYGVAVVSPKGYMFTSDALNAAHVLDCIGKRSLHVSRTPDEWSVEEEETPHVAMAKGLFITSRGVQLMAFEAPVVSSKMFIATLDQIKDTQRDAILTVFLFHVFQALLVLQRDLRFTHHNMILDSVGIYPSTPDAPKHREYTAQGRQYKVPDFGFVSKIQNLGLSRAEHDGQLFFRGAPPNKWCFSCFMPGWDLFCFLKDLQTNFPWTSAHPTVAMLWGRTTSGVSSESVENLDPHPSKNLSKWEKLMKDRSLASMVHLTAGELLVMFDEKSNTPFHTLERSMSNK